MKKRKAASLCMAAAKEIWCVTGAVCVGCPTLGRPLWPDKCSAQNCVARSPHSKHPWAEPVGGSQGVASLAKRYWVLNFIISLILFLICTTLKCYPNLKPYRKEGSEKHPPVHPIGNQLPSFSICSSGAAFGKEKQI